jgi:hypothetical protein
MRVNWKIENFVRSWFAELTGDTHRYDSPALGGDDIDVHYTLEEFAEELLELLRETAEAAKREGPSP